MKYLICSDIHGGLSSTEFIINKYNELSCDALICLGDVLYHGPRNDLPNDYNPKKVLTLLNEIKDKIICIKGNCDAEVDEMVLDFKLFNSLDININDLNCHLEHGHHLDTYQGDANIVLSGHTHISGIEKKDDKYFINPGSITIPKNNTNRSIIIWDNNIIKLIDFDGNESILLKY